MRCDHKSNQRPDTGEYDADLVELTIFGFRYHGDFWVGGDDYHGRTGLKTIIPSLASVLGTDTFFFMQVTKVKYALWAADWQRCLHFYRDLFSGEVTREFEVWSELFTVLAASDEPRKSQAIYSPSS